MTLEDKIQDRLVADTESILEDNLDRVEKLFTFHSDGTVDIDSLYRNATPKSQILIYFIAQRFAKEGNLAEEDTLDTEFFYKRFDRGERTIRDDLQALRESGFISKEGRSDHRIIVEKLPEALARIEENANTNN